LTISSYNKYNKNMIGETRIENTFENPIENSINPNGINPNGIKIPDKTMKLLNKLGNPSNTIGKPITAKTADKHSVPRIRGPWKVAPPPTEGQVDEMHIFRLSVMKNRSWKIDVTDLNTGQLINHCSGSGGVKSMDGQVYTGTELYELTRGTT
jgi:hypothetical protein